MILFFALGACGGQLSGADAGQDASTDAPNDAVASKDASKTSTCTLTLASYTTECNGDGDCIGVFIGDVCTAQCTCANASIASSSQSQYESDLEAIDAGSSITCPCPPPLVACCKGQCAAGPCN